MNRALDLLVAGLALLVTAPLLAACAIAIKLDSRGPVFYRQRRVGRDGVPFELLKLRTMVVGAEHSGAGLYIEAGDARITRVGLLLRRFSLDELPNLLNVLRGELSVVGPRPTVQAMGSPTNGTCPMSCTHQRKPMAVGRCRSSGMTTSDITSQTSGP